MDNFVYLDGKFFDRDSASASMIARSLNARIVSAEKFKHPVCGWSWRLELESLPARLTEGKNL
jgi:hypothetical protein